MLAIKEELTSLLLQVVQELSGEQFVSSLDHPAEKSHGDFASNIALVAAKSLKKNPRDFAMEIVLQLELKKPETVEKIEIAGPGFINFFLSNRYFLHHLSDITTREILLPGVKRRGQKIGIEHTQPNTNKPLHIGHVRNTALGMALVNLKNAAGFECASWNINNDRGIHIVKSMWGYQAFGEGSTPSSITKAQWTEIQKQAEYAGKFDHLFRNKPDHFVGMFYVLGANKYEEDEKAKQAMDTMLIDWEKNVPAIRALWQQMNDWFYEGVWQTLHTLGTRFDQEWFESKIYDKGKALVETGIRDGKLQRADDGHVEADLTVFKLPNVVLLRSNGTALYITQDIELARQRIQDEQFNEAMVITGHEQNLRFKQLYRVCELLGIAQYEQLLHLGYGMVRTKSGKMSSREGTAMSADELVEEVKSRVKELMKEQADEPDFAERLTAVTIGAIKYGMLKHGTLSDITFDIDESIQIDGDSGPYLQYTYARTQSVLRKADSKSSVPEFSQTLGLQPEEIEVLRLLAEYDEVVFEAAEKYAPNILTTYLFDLAQQFNLFYQKIPILKSEDDSKLFRVTLTAAVGNTLKDGLRLLGIQSPERM